MSATDKNNAALKLEALQDLLIEEFTQRIKEGDAAPSLLNAARQLLKDNNIHSSVSEGSPLAELVNVLPFQDDEDDLASVANEWK